VIVSLLSSRRHHLQLQLQLVTTQGTPSARFDSYNHGCYQACSPGQFTRKSDSPTTAEWVALLYGLVFSSNGYVSLPALIAGMDVSVKRLFILRSLLSISLFLWSPSFLLPPKSQPYLPALASPFTLPMGAT
jgi:hypothetical protein